MRIIPYIIVVLLFFSCKHEKKVSDPIKIQEKQPVEIEKKEEPLYQDTSFIAFLELFFKDPEFQLSRIDFPVLKNGESVKNADWESVDYFRNGEFYPYLFQNPTNFSNDFKSFSDLNVEIIDFDNKSIAEFKFQKPIDNWRLIELNNTELDSISEKEFIYFLIAFSADSDYQRTHISFPMKDVAVEQDSLSTTTSSVIEEEQWEYFDFVAEIRFLIIINIPESNNNKRYIYLRGIESGLSVQYLFEKMGEEWKFVQIEDSSV